MDELNISVLVLEDDRTLAECTVAYLVNHGLEARSAATVREFEELRARGRYDILLLDIMLGVSSGLTLCRKIRENSDIPIIFITALGEEADIVLGLEMGADDYLVKPFSSRELLARIHRLIRRVRKGAAPEAGPAPTVNRIAFGDWQLDTRTRLLIDKAGVAYNLSYSQYTVLLYFLEHPDQIIDRDTLLDCLGSGSDNESLQHRLDSHISRLRTTLGDTGSEKSYSRTVRNVGYRFIASPQRREDDR